MLEAGLAQARALELAALRVTCAELERNLSFGVAGRLVRALVAQVPARRRGSLLRKAPALVRPLLEVGPEVGASPDSQSEPPLELGAPSAAGDPVTLAQAHALFTVSAEALGQTPALLAIDDLHWCDQASLEFLLYLANRLDELPVVVLGARRSGADEQHMDVLERIAALRHIRVERLTPLTRAAIGVVVERALGEPTEEAVIEACSHVTGGNPFYLRELLLSLKEGRDLHPSELADQARTLAPEAVIRAVRTRVGRLGRPVSELARAAAILGDDVPLRQAAALAELPLREAASAADALAAADVLASDEPLRFVHPLVRRALYRDLPAFARASRHLEAARLLDSERVEPRARGRAPPAQRASPGRVGGRSTPGGRDQRAQPWLPPFGCQLPRTCAAGTTVAWSSALTCSPSWGRPRSPRASRRRPPISRRRSRPPSTGGDGRSFASAGRRALGARTARAGGGGIRLRYCRARWRDRTAR